MTDTLAQDLLGAWDAGTLIDPLPSRRGLDLSSAYDLAERLIRLREARGERRVGWKIGFTNRTIWQRYGVHAPIWAPVWDTTLIATDAADARVSLAGLSQPRIEPEVVFGFRKAPAPDLAADALLDCIEWVAHGFEIVQTHCAEWRFEHAADTVADFALHGRLVIGPRVPVRDWPSIADDLAALQLVLNCDGREIDRGLGRHVLDGPLHALAAWLRAMAQHTPHWRVQAGECVTTGTITDAWPLKVGQRWSATLSEPRLAGLTLHTN
jgi:2-keto-4-pentenoate hydratase